MLFTIAKIELKELVQLTHELATLDATLAANRTIEPAESFYERRSKMEKRKIELLQKYELL